MIDLRSDTVTRPSAAMLQAMVSAPLGDDVMGDDPTVIHLQEVVAELDQHPAADEVGADGQAVEPVVGLFDAEQHAPADIDALQDHIFV